MVQSTRSSFFLLILLISTINGDTPCPIGDTTNTNERCVHIETTVTNWADSEAFCVARGGHLTSIHNVFDNNIVKSLGNDSACPAYYIGGKCPTPQSCQWTDGTTFNYKNFAPGQPNAAQQCISVVTKTGQWGTVDCTIPSCFICEMGTLMTDCYDWLNAGYKDDGEYSIEVNGQSYKVFCDMNTYGGGWTVIQRRIDGTAPFWNENWQTYKYGFGNSVSGSYWLGNEALHGLTMKDSDVTLRVEMNGDRTPGSSTPNAFWFNHYTNFQVGDETSKYVLQNLFLDWQNIIGNASTGWYDLTYSVGASFSTVDNINDPYPESVTKYQMGGWWLKYSAMASLNGAYIPIDWNNSYGLFWILNGEGVIHPTTTRMMLRKTLS